MILPDEFAGFAASNMIVPETAPLVPRIGSSWLSIAKESPLTPLGSFMSNDIGAEVGARAVAATAMSAKVLTIISVILNADCVQRVS